MVNLGGLTRWLGTEECQMEWIRDNFQVSTFECHFPTEAFPGHPIKTTSSLPAFPIPLPCYTFLYSSHAVIPSPSAPPTRIYEVLQGRDFTAASHRPETVTGTYHVLNLVCAEWMNACAMVCRETEKRDVGRRTGLEKKLLSSAWKFLEHSREGSVGQINTESQNVRFDRYPRDFRYNSFTWGRKKWRFRKVSDLPVSE